MEQQKLYDRDIREPLFDFLESCYYQVRILEEKRMGKSRADVVMVIPDALIGIEIKSDADTYARLASQVKDYDRYYDQNLIVIGTSHVLHIREHVPEHWGIITVELVEGEPDFYFLRRPKSNPNVDWKKKLMILWRPELAWLQEWHGMPKYKDKSKVWVTTKIAERLEQGKLDAVEVRGEVSRLLFERDYTTVSETLSEYRKGEIAKKLEQEEDPQKQVELMMEQSIRRQQFKVRSGRRRRQRR